LLDFFCVIDIGGNMDGGMGQKNGNWAAIVTELTVEVCMFGYSLALSI